MSNKKESSDRNRFENLARTCQIYRQYHSFYACSVSSNFMEHFRTVFSLFSERRQMIKNTGTTISTFLMVFLIQRAQNKESLALQLKLNEIIAATTGASYWLVDIENLSEEDLKS